MSLSRPFVIATLIVGVWIAPESPAHADSAKPIRTTEDALADAASIIEGRVVDVSFSYDPVEGPRTVTTFTDVQTHRGEKIESPVRIATLGGPLPDGRLLVIPELPEFRIGSSYIILLTGSDWFYSPVIGDYAFRVERIGGRELLVTPTGHPVVNISRTEVETAGLSVDPPHFNMRTRFDRPVMVADAAARAATGLTKATFLGLLKDLSKAASAPGTFKRSVARTKVWNVTEADADNAPTCSPEQESELVCPAPSKGGDR